MTVSRFLVIAGLLFGGIFATLAYGNPQWKYCYMFQRYLYPGACKPPEGFGGLWRKWDSSGAELGPFFVYGGREVEIRSTGGGGGSFGRQFSYSFVSGKIFGGRYQGRMEFRRRKDRFSHETFKVVFFNGDGTHEVAFDLDNGVDRRDEFKTKYERELEGDGR